MAANAPIVINDGQSTPVAHTFSGIKIDGNVALYDNRAEVFSAGRETLALRMKSNDRIRTTTATLKVPRVVEETINGVTVKKVADYMTIKVELLTPTTWASDDVQDGRVMTSNLLIHAVPAAMADDGEFVW